MSISSIREKVADNEKEGFITIIMDPIQRFPAEILIPIIQAALPSDGTYSACLLDLTNISQKWQTLLLYTPVLWSHLYIDETQPDFLPLLSLSITLADKVPLNLILFDRPVDDWTGLDSLLPPTYERVISLSLMMTDRERDGRCTGNYGSALSDFFNHFGHPPNLRHLVNDMFTMGLSLLGWVNLPPNVRLVGEIDLFAPVLRRIDNDDHSGEEEEDDNLTALALSQIEDTGRLFDKVKYDIICLGKYHMDRVNHLRPLSLHYHDQSFYGLTLGLTTKAHLPLSECLTNSLDECYSFEQLIYVIASSLCSLTIYIKPDFIGDLVDCLPEFYNLQALALTVHYAKPIQPPILNRTKVVVPTLQDLKFTITKGYDEEEEDEDLAFKRTKEYRSAVRDEDLSVELFELLTRLYPRIQRLSLDVPSWPSDNLSRFESWKSLKDLELNLRFMRSSSIELLLNLPSVQTLWLDSSAPVGGLTAPNLCRLTLKDTHLTARLGINTPALYYLTIRTGHGGEQGDFYPDPTAFPGIKKLCLDWGGTVSQWRLGSFLHLLSIELVTSLLFNNPLGDSLCVHFIYHPDSCPSLQELSSDRCFEWDLLFLMLQQRNFGRKNTRKIRTVTMPFVPFAFREHLELSLAGKHSEGPSFISQTLEATREVIFDANIPGCYCCLKNQRPNCTESIQKGLAIWFEYDLYPRLEKPPGAMAQEICDYLLWHEVLVHEWMECYATSKFRREDICDRWSGRYMGLVGYITVP